MHNAKQFELLKFMQNYPITSSSMIIDQFLKIAML